VKRRLIEAAASALKSRQLTANRGKRHQHENRRHARCAQRAASRHHGAAAARRMASIIAGHAVTAAA